MELFKGPQRGHRVVICAGADTAELLADELRHLADMIDRDEMTRGTSGSPSSGSMWEYLRDPAMTHDAYFAAVNEWLAARKSPEPPPT